MELAAGSLTKPQIRYVYRGTVRSMIIVAETTSSVDRQFVLQLLRIGPAVRALTRNPEFAGLLGGDDAMPRDVAVPDTLDDCLDWIELVFQLWSFFMAEAAPAFLDAATKYVRCIFYPLSEGVDDDREQPPYMITARTDAELST